jgi:3-oxoacyl-[acyl-carrier-protein] synthase II
MRRRVVITGLGCVTPLGNTPERVWERLVSGQSGVSRLTVFDPERSPVQIAAEVRDWPPQESSLAFVSLRPDAEPRSCEPRPLGSEPGSGEERSLEDARVAGDLSGSVARAPRQLQFMRSAGQAAARRAGLDAPGLHRGRIGLYLGCGEPFEDFDSFTESISRALRDGSWSAAASARASLRLFEPDAEYEYEPHRAAVHLARLLAVEGPVRNCVSACVSATQAIGEAAQLIRRGVTDLMVCGGAHSTIHRFGVTGFHRLSALSTRNDDPAGAVRPFDRDRDGFVIGEGAAAIVLEELEHARARGAEILAELCGYGSAQDAYRITDSHPDGRGTVAAVQRALADSRLSPAEIDYINAHGTGTVLNDRVETRAIRQVFGSAADRIPVSSSKSMLGHATTACGAIELMICVMTLRSGVVHPTINYHTPDPDCDLDYVPNAAREWPCQYVLSQNIGFGGQNAALVVSRFEEPSRARVARAA